MIMIAVEVCTHLCGTISQVAAARDACHDETSHTGAAAELQRLHCKNALGMWQVRIEIRLGTCWVALKAMRQVKQQVKC